jgi:hypothetical protein
MPASALGSPLSAGDNDRRKAMYGVSSPARRLFFWTSLAGFLLFLFYFRNLWEYSFWVRVEVLVQELIRFVMP